MPEETKTDEEQEAHPSEIVHDDIMQRLLEYQRQLREGISPDQAAEAKTTEAERPLIDYAAAETIAATTTETAQVVDITEAEAELEQELQAAEAVPAETEPVLEEEPSTPEPAADAAPVVVIEPVVVIGEPPAEEPTAPMPPPVDLTARVAELEDTLSRVSQMIGDLRGRFQDMAIASDERLAAIEEMLAGIGSTDTT